MAVQNKKWTVLSGLGLEKMNQNISKKRKFVADGVFYSELNEVRCENSCFFGGEIWFLGHVELLNDLRVMAD